MPFIWEQLKDITSGSKYLGRTAAKQVKASLRNRLGLVDDYTLLPVNEDYIQKVTMDQVQHDQDSSDMVFEEEKEDQTQRKKLDTF